MRKEQLHSIRRLLASLRGIVDAHPAGSELLDRVVEQEAQYEKGAFLPLKNLGVREVRGREVAFVLLKNGLFRGPPAPTVYLVEDAGDQPSRAGEPPLLEVGERRFRILGEEVLASRKPYREKTLFLADSFVLFPTRRAVPRAPSYFLMPPLGFPELEQRQEELGIRRVISISPSALCDLLLRESCAFRPDATLATLLVGFDWA
jgi:hypothetical protein